MRFSEGLGFLVPTASRPKRRGDVLFLLNHSDRAAEVAGVVVHRPPGAQTSFSSTTLT